MYVPKCFLESRLEVLHDLMMAYPFATLTTVTNNGLEITHIPFVVDTTHQPYGLLKGHVARSNPVWRDLNDVIESVVVFQGPQSYISPSWYPSKRDHGKVVPTWNYTFVHAHGIPKARHDKEWLYNHLTELTDLHESTEPRPWKLTDAPKAYREKMLEAIVGVEMPITKLIGKWKVSQNRPHEDKLGVIKGLRGRRDEQSAAMAALVRNVIP